MRRTLTAAVAVAAIAIAIAAATACGHAASSPDASAASQHVSSALANPTVSSDLTVTEQQLLANLQANFAAAHPVKSVEAAIKATFPQGDTGKIATYAVKTFTLSVLHTSGPGSARDAWLQAVVTYAQSQGARPAPSRATPAPSAVTT